MMHLPLPTLPVQTPGTRPMRYTAGPAGGDTGGGSALVTEL